jgi:hypothetical protein
MILAGKKPKNPEKNLSKCHSLNHKSRMDRRGTEPKSPRLQHNILLEVVVIKRATDRRVTKANYVRVSRTLESEEIKDLCTEEAGSSRHLFALFIGMFLHRTLTGAPTVVTNPPQITEYTSK